MLPYTTLLKEGRAESIEKKSRFLAAAAPVCSEEEALAFIDGQRRLHKGANHHCYAYRIGAMLERFSDDGEPGGTAGMPILDVLRGPDIRNAVIVVTRFFGGTLLGTGGLVRAYGHSAKNAAQSAAVVEKKVFVKISIASDYTASGKIQYEILQRGGVLVDTIYTAGVEFIVAAPAEDVKFYEDMAAEASSGSALTEVKEKLYAAFHEGSAYYFSQ